MDGSTADIAAVAAASGRAERSEVDGVSEYDSASAVVAESWEVASSMKPGAKTWLARLASSRADSYRRPIKVMATVAIEAEVCC